MPRARHEVRQDNGRRAVHEKDIFELLEYLKKNDIRITVETNGTLVKGREAKALKEAGASHVGVSLDGPDERIHSRLRESAALSKRRLKA